MAANEESAGAVASPDTTEAGKTAQPTPLVQEHLKFSVADVMRRAGIPEDVRKLVAKKEGDEQKAEVPAKETEVAEDKAATPEPEEKAPEKEEVKAEETGEEVEEEEVEESKLPPEAKKLLKRIDKITGQRESAKERAAALEEQNVQLQAALEQASPIVLAPTEKDPIAYVQNIAQLEQVKKEAKFLKSWARRYPNGLVANEGQQNQREVPVEEVADILSRAENMLDLLPEKEKQINATNYLDGEAKKVFPNLFNPKHEDYHAARNVLINLPEIALNPNRAYWVGDYLRGYRLRMAEQGKNGQATTGAIALDKRITAPKAPIAEDTVKPPTRGAVPSSRKKLEEAEQRVRKSGGDLKSLKNYIKTIQENRSRTGKREAVLA